MTVHAAAREWGLRLLVVVFIVAGSSFETSAAEPLSDRALVEKLRSGGFNIYFRHAETDWSQSDWVRAAGDWWSCDGERIRQLSDAGRATARAVGEAMRRLGVPVGRVLSSPYCRCRETAELLGFGTPEPTTDVMNLRVAEYFGGRERIVQTARSRLASVPTPATNTVIVAHGNVAREATPVYPDEAEAVVFQPLGGAQFTVVARITPARWADMVRALSAR